MEQKKKEKTYDETNLIKIEGQGRTKEDICLSYLEFINSGFSLTIEEIASYLRCTYQYVLDKIVPEVPHIRITEVSKLMLFKYAIEHDLDEEISSLFVKRILFHRGEFQRYVCNSAESVISFKRFYERDFEAEVVLQMKQKLAILNQKSTGKSITFEKYMQRVMDSFMWRHFKNEPITKPKIDIFPPQLFSQRDLMNIFGVNHKVEFYRHLDTLGINKVKLNNLVRYRVDEVEETFQARMYITAFLHLKNKHGEEYMTVIQKRALELLD
ncbi:MULTISPECIES: hypothetical protein [Cytobacillus]|uniref:Uncharacterized protein n=2 Tax=Bacillati TaxID=1783272 RepID=A0A2N0Z9A2_9BACI|nr:MULTISPECIES: hypothetical protein [Cytobacillus]MDK7667361.1 hypothetical protein [Cytobacillus oceanisediminis]MEC1157787.1 hypothetical protein [Cytobacillus horneckiae]PKG26077.1 hypothetical protein CWS20_25895 [Cytobacillus horneckiae]